MISHVSGQLGLIEGGGGLIILMMVLLFVGLVLPASWSKDPGKREDARKALALVLRFFRPQR